MSTTQQTRLAALRDPLTILKALENKHLKMDASEYLLASRRVLATLRSLSILELIVITRGMVPVLSQLAENVLIERGADHLADDALDRTRARDAAEALVQRL